eukprot:gene31460-38854_t
MQTVIVKSGAGLLVQDQTAYKIRYIDLTTTIVSVVIGTGSSGLTGDGGPATSATIATTYGMQIDTATNIYVSDQSNSRVRKMNALTKVISSYIGGGGSFTNGVAATSTSISNPIQLYFDTASLLYIACHGDNVVRTVNPSSGIITTIAGVSGSSGFTNAV